MHSDLSSRVLELLSSSPKLKARDIATRLGVDRSSLNSLLFGPLSKRVSQDRQYRWFLRSAASAQPPTEASAAQPRGPLTQLCRYYLECISRDSEIGISEFARSQFQLKYLELPKLPFVSDDDPLTTPEAHAFLGRTRQDRLQVYLGYPLRLRWIKTRTGWEGYKLDPLLLFPFRREPTNTTDLGSISDETPILNSEVLKSFRRANSGYLIDEIILMSEDLGLANSPGELPEPDEIALRLRQIRPDWDWCEEINPERLSDGPPMAAIDKPGIYNRAALFVTEPSRYTKGLETELNQLAGLTVERVSGTALGRWLGSSIVACELENNLPLLEPVPLNAEQRSAIARAFSQDLTVITGPPGTGKSQLVTALLVNAAWRGQKVIFASKNNKAVDVVEERVNGLGSRPILLRLGANQFQGRLAMYLAQLLASVTEPNDYAQYKECETRQVDLRNELESLDRELTALIKLRNRVDDMEKLAEVARQRFGNEIFHRLHGLDLAPWKRVIADFAATVRAADRKQQSFFRRCIWTLSRKKRIQALDSATDTISKFAAAAHRTLPTMANFDERRIDLFIALARGLDEDVEAAQDAITYFTNLQHLNAAIDPAKISAQRIQILEKVAKNSEALWRCWLRIQPSKLDQQGRQTLGQYAAIVQLMAAGGDGQGVGRQVFRQFFSLFPKVTKYLPCWAVTSLSARGRIPLEPSFFDLVVIDEASQCDIASALPLLFRAKRAVIIGDPNQLKHISGISPRQDRALLEQHGLVSERANWSYSTTSLFDLAATLARPADIVVLRDHHRSHADIIGFPNRHFYGGTLRVATKYQHLRPRPHGYPAVRWIDVRGEVRRPSEGGAINRIEVDKVVTELRRIVIDNGYKGSIGVVSPFRAQANAIREAANADGALSQALMSCDFLADTVHRFQGDERDLMIFSPVVANGMPDGALSFLRGNENLFNVAITRARSALVVVGDLTAAGDCGIPYLEGFASYINTLEDRQAVREPSSEPVGPDYPTVARPETVSSWEKVFYRALYQAGIRPIPQYDVDQYTLDFAIIQGDRRLNVEVDGEMYHRAWDGELSQRDQIRNQRLMELGWDVTRFWVYQIRDDLDKSVARVQRWVMPIAASDHPSEAPVK